MFTPKDYYMDWSKKDEMFGHTNQIIFMILPWLLLFIVFLFRKKFSAVSNKTKNITYITMGLMMIGWELWFDIGSIVNRADGINVYDQMYQQFIDGFDFCRMNMYIAGTFMVICKPQLVKWVAATSLFGGYSTLFDHYDKQADVHSLMTHSVFLAVFPSLVVTISGTNYKVRDLIGAHLFNWLLVAIMYTVNVYTGSVAGELTEDRMADNMIAGFAPWPINMFIWILAVMMLEWAYFITFRILFWRTHLAKQNIGFWKSFALEWPQDKKQWFGIKFWAKEKGELNE